MPSELRTYGLWVAVIGVVVTGIIAVIQIRSDDSDQARITECREEHSAPKTPDGSDFAAGTWGDCDWPPADGAAADGYGEIDLSRVDNGSPSNSGYMGADVFDTQCAQLSVQYRHDQQGIQTISDQDVVAVGQILRLVLVDESGLQLKPAAMPDFVDLEVDEVEGSKLIVLVPIAVSVQSVECA